MREGFDKEIDSLLRRTARASVGVRGNGAGESKSDSHLDADELAAFAEGALPEAARLNIVSHLADCDECRVLAVNLTRAAGVETELEKRALVAKAASASSSTARESGQKRGWLATLFAPRTLSYVAPVLVLCLVGAVSFIALRSRKGDLANLERPNSSSRPDITAPQESAQSSSVASSNTNSSANANTASAVQSAEKPLVSDNGLADDKEAPRPEKKDAIKEDMPDGSGAPAGEKASGSETSAAAPPPPPPPASKETGDDAKASAPTEMAKSAPADTPPASKSGEHMKAGPPPPSAQNSDELASNSAAQMDQPKRGAQQRGMEPQSPDGARNRAGSAANNSAGGGAFGMSSRNEREARQQRDSNARRGRSDEGAAAESDGANTAEESRSVAGHRFRRDGSAWVDVNYKSSMSSTGVRRGTDQYRALVADIPEIGRVAEQLGGEIFVVVRGRAYHIR